MKIINWKWIIIILVVAGVSWYFVRDKNNEILQNSEKNYPFINPELVLRYHDDELGFFVDYPEGFNVNNLGEENMKVLVFSKTNSHPPAGLPAQAGEAEESFQIYVIPYDEPGPITPERILIDQPDIIMKDPQTVEIAGEEALIFYSTDPDIGDVREVWFVHGGHLYQASTYAKYDELLAKVMRTLTFK